MNFTSITDVQKNTKKVFSDKAGFQVVLSHNKNVGMILNAELSQHMLDSGLMQQIKEEMWELNDATTRQMVADVRENNYDDAVDFDEFIKENEL